MEMVTLTAAVPATGVDDYWGLIIPAAVAGCVLLAIIIVGKLKKKK